VDLGGALEVDEEVASVVEASAAVLSQAGGVGGLGLARPVARRGHLPTLRAWLFQDAFGELLAEHPDAFKSSLADNIRAGESLTGADVARAYAQRTALSETMRAFFTSYDVLALPVSQVPPFPADQEFPAAINGRPMETYLDWMRSAYLITVTGCPAISVPAGTTEDGLPVGLQLVGPARQRAPAAGCGRGVRGRRRAARPTGDVNPQDYPPLRQICGYFCGERHRSVDDTPSAEKTTEKFPSSSCLAAGQGIEISYALLRGCRSGREEGLYGGATRRSGSVTGPLGPDAKPDRPEVSQDRSTEGPLQLILARALRLSRMTPVRCTPPAGGPAVVHSWTP
jgi:hypothetical protein